MPSHVHLEPEFTRMAEFYSQQCSESRAPKIGYMNEIWRVRAAYNSSYRNKHPCSKSQIQRLLSFVRNDNRWTTRRYGISFCAVGFIRIISTKFYYSNNRIHCSRSGTSAFPVNMTEYTSAAATFNIRC